MKAMIVSVLCVAMLLTAGCFSRGKKAETAAPPDAPATAAPADEPTPTTVPAAEEPEPAAAQGSPAEVKTVENADAINSYRMRITTTSESAGGVDSVEIEGMFVKEPPAEQLMMQFMEGDDAQSMEMVAVDGNRYFKNDDMWIQTPDDIMRTEELTVMTPDDAADMIEAMTYVGVETVNGREADHYRGDRDSIPVMGGEGDTLDVSEIEFAQMDIWIDRAEQVVVKFLLEASDSADETPVHMSISTEYLDFNQDFVIEAPEMAGGVSIGGVADAAPAGDTTTDLGQVLGFDLLLPTGSTIQMAAGDTLLVAATPYTFEEAEKWIELNMPANGYTQMTKMGPADGQILFMFQNDSKMVTVTIMDEGDGLAVVQFAAMPQ